MITGTVTHPIYVEVNDRDANNVVSMALHRSVARTIALNHHELPPKVWSLIRSGAIINAHHVVVDGEVRFAQLVLPEGVYALLNPDVRIEAEGCVKSLLASHGYPDIRFDFEAEGAFADYGDGSSGPTIGIDGVALADVMKELGQ